MAQTFSPLRHRHSLLPEAVGEHFSSIAAFLYVLLECDRWVCFSSSPDLEKYLASTSSLPVLVFSVLNLCF